MPALAEPLLQALLDAMPVARLALIAGGQRPEALPIVFARVGSTLYSPVDGKPKKAGRLARLAHLERQPAVGLTLDHYAADWRDLWWLKLDVQASVAVDDAPGWDAAVAALRVKYPQYRETPLFRGEPTLIVMPWTRVRWWAADGEAGLRRWLADISPQGADPCG
ncbi:MAG: TIGR03668 family PPOX class F420-dependent oxidoreductase [Gammaproteobacteria bacterium]